MAVVVDPNGAATVVVASAVCVALLQAAVKAITAAAAAPTQMSQMGSFGSRPDLTKFYTASWYY
jgi:hypothetical protein